MAESTRHDGPLGSRKVVCVSNQRTGIRGVPVIDNPARGKGKAGTRLAPTEPVRAAARLARVVMWKRAAANPYYGRAEVGIRYHATAEEKAVARSFARAQSNEVPSGYVFESEMGLTKDDAAIIVGELGYPAAVSTPSVLYGIPYDELRVTGFGMAEAARSAAQWSGSTVEGTAVASSWVWCGEQGRRGPTDSVEGMLADAFDIVVPAATQGVIDDSIARRMRARLIVEGANMPRTMPRWPSCPVGQSRWCRTHSNTATILDSSRPTSLSPHAAAGALVQERVEIAMLAHGQKASEGMFLS